MSTEIDWPSIQKALALPFSAAQVHWRIQGSPDAEGMAQVLAYLDARDIFARLDSAVGIGNWSSDWQPIVTSDKGLLVAKGTITIYGISKSDVGDASSFEGTKGTVSDALKRAAVQWGIGRYLYDLPSPRVKTERGKLGKAALDDLSQRLAAWQAKRAS